jgi:hypothetical protein
MRIPQLLSAVVLVLVSVQFVAAQTTEDRVGTVAILTGFHEVPSVSTTGLGEMKARLSDDGRSINFALVYRGLMGAPTAAHIHFGQRFTNGGIITTLCGGSSRPACPPAGTPLTGTISSSDITGPEKQGIAPGEFEEVLRAIRRGHTYVNVHTDKFPDGEIRGQIWGRHRDRNDGDEGQSRPEPNR